MPTSPVRQSSEYHNRWIAIVLAWVARASCPCFGLALARRQCHPVAILLVLAAQAALGASPDQSVKLTTVGVEVMPCQANLISDPGFEQSPANGIPSGWQWTRGKTDATCAIDRTVAHSGRQSLRMTNGTPFGPNVYGMLWRTQPVKLIWGKPYTMSAWVKSDEPGGVELIGGGDWQYRAGPRGRRWVAAHLDQLHRRRERPPLCASAEHRVSHPRHVDRRREAGRREHAHFRSTRQGPERQAFSGRRRAGNGGFGRGALRAPLQFD